MLKALLSFYGLLILQLTWRPVWMDSQKPDKAHFHRRRFTEDYRRRRVIVERVWLFTGLLLLGFPSPPLVVTGLILATFVSFSILDETE
ncbi:MAG: hypothetical protein AseanaTS_26330 [Candidatus Pelagadaptatus aseana]|uniref:hypothetical protein n=1 Tax=Candidatus Pelagadaptatus aseana TaxID=3120508 RepID=UPI0039B18884